MDKSVQWLRSYKWGPLGYFGLDILRTESAFKFYMTFKDPFDYMQKVFYLKPKTLIFSI